MELPLSVMFAWLFINTSSEHVSCSSDITHVYENRSQTLFACSRVDITNQQVLLSDIIVLVWFSPSALRTTVKEGK